MKVAAQSRTKAGGTKMTLGRLLLVMDIKATARGHKSSEGDGRTAADIKREMQERKETN